MNAKKLVALMIILAFACLGMVFLTGCVTLGVDTDFGRFTYELPLPKGTKK
jgi:hypothetical protein